jgi:glycosyltransferase involved in cell wall biosynthesis
MVKITVVIPALNEARNIPHVLSRLPADLHEVIIVDGRSVDDTPGTARRLRPDVKIITQNRCGKGNALACGFAAATGDIVVMLDADGSADPGEIPQFVDALLDGADFAKGSRFLEGGGSDDITRLRRLGNRALGGIVNALFGTHYSDLCYGYNAFWRYCFPQLDLDTQSTTSNGQALRLWGDGFEIETLINIRIAQIGLKVREVPSYEYTRIHGVSNLNAVRDGLRVLRTIIVEWRRPGGCKAALRRAGPDVQAKSSRLAAPLGDLAAPLGDLATPLGDLGDLGDLATPLGDLASGQSAE